MKKNKTLESLKSNLYASDNIQSIYAGSVSAALKLWHSLQQAKKHGLDPTGIKLQEDSVGNVFDTVADKPAGGVHV